MSRKIRFTKDYDYKVNEVTDIAYLKGQEVLVPNAHAEAAIEAGVAEAAGDAEAEDEPKKAEAKNAEVKNARSR